MKTGTVCGVVTVMMLAGSIGSFADVKDNPYQVIIDRNPFALRPIPPPPPPATNNAAEIPAPAQIYLTGISTLLGPPKVFIEIEDTKTKKRERPPPLMIGEAENGVEIVSINADEGTVRVKHNGAETTLDFDKNGIKPAATASAAPAVPGVPSLRPGVPPPAPPATAGASAANSSAIVLGNTYNPAAPTPAVPTATALPPRPLRVDSGFANSGVIVAGAGQPVQNTPAPQATPPPMTREEAEIRIEAQRRALQEREAAGGQPGISRILPPTRFTAPAPPAPGQAQ